MTGFRNSPRGASPVQDQAEIDEIDDARLRPDPLERQKPRFDELGRGGRIRARHVVVLRTPILVEIPIALLAFAYEMAGDAAMENTRNPHGGDAQRPRAFGHRFRYFDRETVVWPACEIDDLHHVQAGRAAFARKPPEQAALVFPEIHALNTGRRRDFAAGSAYVVVKSKAGDAALFYPICFLVPRQD